MTNQTDDATEEPTHEEPTTRPDAAPRGPVTEGVAA